MRMSLRSAILAAAVCLASGAPAQPTRDAALLGPMAQRLNNLVGTWQVKAQIQFTPSAAPVTIEAVAENRLVGGRWLISELRSRDGMNGFHGIGVNGYDPAAGKYVGYWIDSTRSLLIPVEGAYDESARLFRTTSVERNRDGKTTTVISETRVIGPDQEVTTFTAPDSGGTALHPDDAELQPPLGLAVR